VRAVDFQFDETADRRRIKLCNIADEYTREALTIRVGRSCTADDVMESHRRAGHPAAPRVSAVKQRTGNNPEHA
jgi:putative transposase